MEMDAGLDNTGHDKEGSDATGRETAGQSGPRFRNADRAYSDPSQADPPGADPPDVDAPDAGAPDLPDMGKLARDWITLWQSELSAMAADPEIRESWQTVMALWAGTMSAVLRGLPRDHRNDGTRGRPGTADAPRSAPAAAAPDARDAEIDLLARHVAALERRLAELERGGDPPGGAGGNPKHRPGRKSRH